MTAENLLFKYMMPMIVKAAYGEVKEQEMLDVIVAAMKIYAAEKCNEQREFCGKLAMKLLNDQDIADIIGRAALTNLD